MVVEAGVPVADVVLVVQRVVEEVVRRAVAQRGDAVHDRHLPFELERQAAADAGVEQVHGAAGPHRLQVEEHALRAVDAVAVVVLPGRKARAAVEARHLVQPGEVTAAREHRVRVVAYPRPLEQSEQSTVSLLLNPNGSPTRI